MLHYLDPNAKLPDQVAILTRTGCSFCARAKKMLDEAGYSYAEIPLPHTIRSKAVGAIAKAQTVPQVFINGQLIGDSDALEAYLKRQQGQRERQRKAA
jgi:glutaredoxin-like protein